VAAVLTAIGVAGTAAPSYADDTVTVSGTAFPDPARAALSLVGCADLYQRTDEPLLPTVGRGPGTAPAGTRSLGWDLAGGNAVGALFPTASVLGTTTASLAVDAAGRATGVAYAGYQEPADAGTTLLWLGRSELVTRGGAWQTFDAAARSYTWTKYDMTTRQPVVPATAAPATVPDFAAAHGGDGPGLYSIGFGCDGAPFWMDRLQVGQPGAVTTYDVEALRTAVTITAVSGRGKDGPVTLEGRLRTDTGDPVPDATMVLERRVSDRAWEQVLVADVDHGVARATVPGDERATYRWRFVDRPLAEASTSEPWLVDVLPPVVTDPPSPTGSPSPSGEPSPSGGPDPSEPPSTATPSPSLSPSASASITVSASPSPSASVTPTDLTDESAEPSGSDPHGTP